MRVREQGTIKWFNFHKCYGFIIPDSGGPDVMLHIAECRACNYMPQNDGRVVFEAERQQNGMKAVRVEEGL
jgi:CspA family cold shock protein